jgi:hypothetical protein
VEEELESVEGILSKEPYNSTIEMGKLFGVPENTSEFIASIQDLIEKIDAMDVNE